MVRLLLEGIHAQVFPGAVLFVRHQGYLRMHHAVGLTSGLPDAYPVQLQTIYDLASLTKPLAAASAILLLVQDGHLDLSTSIDRWLPETKNFQHFQQPE